MLFYPYRDGKIIMGISFLMAFVQTIEALNGHMIRIAFSQINIAFLNDLAYPDIFIVSKNSTLERNRSVAKFPMGTSIYQYVNTISSRDVHFNVFSQHLMML